MELVLNEEQKFLRQAAKDFVNARSPLSRVRKLRKTGAFWSREIWKEMAELGWLGLTIDEAHGGTALGHRYLMVVLAELGAKLVPEPIVSTALLGATAIQLGGSFELKQEHLPAMVKGDRVVALAHQERYSRFSLSAIDATADPAGARTWALRGEKIHVQDGGIADYFVVTARAPDGFALFLVPARAKGMSVQPEARLDGRSSALVRLEGVVVTEEARLGGDRGLRLLERVIDVGTAGLVAEMLGSMTAAFGMTLEHLKTRMQFDVPIGSFQVLQHRAARLFIETELARSAVMHVNGMLDEDGDAGAAVSRAVSVAKAKCSDAFMRVAHESVQMHGGIGMTDEHDIGLYLKRARVCEMTFGDSAFHRDRFARLGGF
ncbi:MAG TPA: acyl-CoA dehydrogenase family protein [Labilithrix sp.]|nr:acyl-CoA dehydrogenase family protein [Labilithrix sp.]